jgi:hypothetical protein
MKSRGSPAKGDQKKLSARDIIRNFFLDNLGRVVTREQIIAAVGRDVENWHQRLSELRTDEGFTILAHKDRADLKTGQYLMPTAKQNPIAARRRKPTDATWAVVLKRAKNACEWHEAGVKCGLASGDTDAIGGGRVKRWCREFG